MENFFSFLYNNEKFLIIIDTNSKIWFCGNDIANILEYKAPKKMIESYVPAKSKLYYEQINVPNKIFSKSYQKKSIFIDESGLFRLVFRSKQKNAVDFQNWVTDEVLPQLRERGYFLLNNKIELLQHKFKKCRQQKQSLINEIDYLDNNKQYQNAVKGYLYIIRIKTHRRGKKITCYKLGPPLVYRLGDTSTTEPSEKVRRLGDKFSEVILIISKFVYKNIELAIPTSDSSLISH